MATFLSKEKQKQLQEEQEEQKRRQDNKQHCQKILDGIGKFDNTTAERAVWELIQNARDLSEHAKVKLTLTRDHLIFTHEGSPFDYESFTSLIKQISSVHKEEKDTVGQFGTGFMTTHKFSRIVKISGSVKLDEGIFVDIEDFELDRRPDDLQGMLETMSKQLTFADKLLDQETRENPRPETTFVYQLDEIRLPYAEKGIGMAFDLIPYVMVLNERIEEVYLEDTISGKSVLFRRGVEYCLDQAIGYYKVPIIQQGGDDKAVYFLRTEDKKDIIILPLKAEDEAISLGAVPKFFIHFPLLGTESFGVNYVFHSDRFYPEEPRNAIVLPEDNIEKKSKYTHNADVFRFMRDNLYTYLEKYSDSIKHSHLLASIGLLCVDEKEDAERARFCRDLQKEFVTKFQSLPFVLLQNNTKVSVINDKNVRFLAPDIVAFLRKDDGEEYLDVIYGYASRISTLPAKEVVLTWSEIIEQWKVEESSIFIYIDELVTNISSREDDEGLLQFLRFLKECGQDHYFKEKALIPNREGERKVAKDLRNAKDIPEELYRICTLLIPESTRSFVSDAYTELYNLTEYRRDDLKKDINLFISSLKSQSSWNDDELTALIKYCSIFPTAEGSSTRDKAMPFICQLHNHPYKRQYVPPLPGIEVDKEQDLYRTAFDTLVDYSLKVIEGYAKDESRSWLKEVTNSTLHYSLLQALSNKDRGTTYQKELFPKYAIIPNQEGELCYVEELSALANRKTIPASVQDKLLELYQEVFGTSYRAKLIDERYVELVQIKDERAQDIGRMIEDKLKEREYTHPSIIEIIELLDSEAKEQDKGYWSSWFSYIDSNKANIFLGRLQGDERSHTYQFMKAHPSRKERVAKLMDNPNFERIMAKAEESIRAEKEQAATFKHMLIIGKTIENQLREHLQEELLVECREMDKPMEVNDIQNGQDIVIKHNGEVVFFIEVKSKWNFDQPAHMSTNQMRQAVLNPDCYALCCVDLTEHRASDLERLEAETVIGNTYVHLDIGQKLGFFLKEIIYDSNDEETHLKIKDYQSSLNKGFFTSGIRGLDSLIEAILKRRGAVS
nr:DUF3883 domain-containing protein [uncultured Porphyromonas sp.]